MRIFLVAAFALVMIQNSCVAYFASGIEFNQQFFHIATGLVPGASGTFIRTFKEMLNNRISYFRYFVQPDVFSFSSE
jgi:hypothetical protein